MTTTDGEMTERARALRGKPAAEWDGPGLTVHLSYRLRWAGGGVWAAAIEEPRKTASGRTGKPLHIITLVGDRRLRMTAAAAVTTNAWCELARERKAAAVLDVLCRVDPTLTADEAAQMDQRGRRAAAHLARVNPLSDEAWAVLVTRLRKREAAA